MKKLLVLLIVAAFVGTAFVAVAQDKGPGVIKMDKAKTGVVTFDHAKHQADVPDCNACHHTDGFETCSSCHRKLTERRSLTRRLCMTIAKAATKLRKKVLPSVKSVTLNNLFYT